MAATVPDTMHEGHEPNDKQEKVLELMKNEQGGRVTPLLVREETGLPRQRVNEALGDLVTAGWVEKRTKGLYQLVADPRDEE